MPRRPRRRAPIPGPPDAEACRRLPFDDPDPEARKRFTARLLAGVDLTPAERAAAHRLNLVVAGIERTASNLRRRGHDLISAHGLYADEHTGECVIAILSRSRNTVTDCHPYAVGTSRIVDAHLTIATRNAGLRVDNAWPQYRALQWPPWS